MTDAPSDLIPQDQDNTTRNFLWPIGLTRRPSMRRLIRKYPRAVEWIVDLVEIAREALAGGKLLACGEPLTIEDLETHNSTNHIDQTFLAELIKIGFLAHDENCYSILKWSDFYRYKSQSRESQSQRKREERLRKQHFQNAQTVANTQEMPNVTTMSRVCHDHVTTVSRPCHDLPDPDPGSGPGTGTGPLPLPSPSPSPDARAREEGVATLRGEGSGRTLRAAAGGDGPTAKGRLIEHACERFANLRLTGRLTGAERKRVEGWVQAVAGCNPQAVRWAIDAAVAHTQADRLRMSIDSPVGYALEKIENHLEAALGQISANEISQARGRPTHDYVFRPPEREAS